MNLVALLSHHIRVPELVDVVVVAGSQLAVSLAHPMTRAVVGTGGSLAGVAFVPDEAHACRAGSVADALVGALHVVVCCLFETGSVRLFLLSIMQRRGMQYRYVCLCTAEAV